MLQRCRLNDWDLEYDESLQFHCVDLSAEIFAVSINSRSSDNYWNIIPWYQQKGCEHTSWCSNRNVWERTGLEEIDLDRTLHHFIDLRITWPRHIVRPFSASMLSSVASIESQCSNDTQEVRTLVSCWYWGNSKIYRFTHRWLRSRWQLCLSHIFDVPSKLKYHVGNRLNADKSTSRLTLGAYVWQGLSLTQPGSEIDRWCSAAYLYAANRVLRHLPLSNQWWSMLVSLWRCIVRYRIPNNFPPAGFEFLPMSPCIPGA
jgi:hypothetical protein